MELFAGEHLMFSQQIGLQLYVAGFIDAVNIPKARSNTEVRPDFAQRVVDVKDIFGLRVKACVVNAGVVDTVFLAAGDADLHFEPQSDGSHALEILDARRDVLFLGLFGEIEHVGGEECLLVFFKVRLVSLQHPVEPRKELVGTVVAVQNNRAEKDGISVTSGADGCHLHAVRLGHSADMMGCGNCARNRSLLLIVGKTFASEVCATSLRNLNNNGGFNVPMNNVHQHCARIKYMWLPRSFENGIGRRRGGYILALPRQ
jgi:hypothetical protein